MGAMRLFYLAPDLSLQPKGPEIDATVFFSPWPRQPGVLLLQPGHLGLAGAAAGAPRHVGEVQGHLHREATRAGSSWEVRVGREMGGVPVRKFGERGVKSGGVKHGWRLARLSSHPERILWLLDLILVWEDHFNPLRK